LDAWIKHHISTQSVLLTTHYHFAFVSKRMMKE
jgi:hypothetical protein